MSGLVVAGLSLLAYLVGSISWSFILVKRRTGIDLRTVGSGNLGATNAGRVLGKRWAIAVYSLDLAKGAAGASLPLLLDADPTWHGMPVRLITGLCAVLGHMFPFHLGFRGGKGVATGSGVVFALAPLTGLLALLVWGLLLKVTRMVSAASIGAAASLPLLHALLPHGPHHAWYEGFFILVATLVIALHRDNIRRILAGREHRIGGDEI